MKHVALLIAAGTFLALSPSALAQRSQEPVPTKTFGWLDFGGNLYAKGLFNTETRTTGNNKIDQKQSLLREGVQFKVRPYIYHPNLLDMRFFADLGLSQESYSDSEQTYNTKGTLTSYDLSGVVLREKFLSGNFGISRSDDLSDRDFGQSLKTTRDRYAAGLRSKGNFPASILFERITRNEQNDTRTADVQTNQTTFRIADRRSINWLTDLVFQHEDTQETDTYTSPGIPSITEQVPVKRDELNVTNVYKFGPGKEKHTLTGRLRWLDRKGWYMEKDLAIDQTLDLHHSDTFSTFYRASYENQQTPGDTEKSYDIGAGLTKQFYDSLTAGLQGSYRNTTYLDGYNKFSRILGSLDYTKKTLAGLFRSSLQVSQENEDQSHSGGFINIRNEAVTLTDITPVQLQRANITPGSILVMDANNVVTYFEGTDYVLTSNGAFTQIARKLPGSNITSGQTVHVSYTVPVPRNYSVRTDRVDWLNRLAIRDTPLSVYLKYRSRKDTLTGGRDPNNLEDETQVTYGIEYNRYGLRVRLEHEQDDRILSPPTRSNRIEATYARTLSRDLNLNLGAHYNKTRYLDAMKYGLEPGRDTLDDVGASAELTAKLSRYLLLRLGSEYSSYKGYQNQSLFRNGVGVEYRQGKLSFTVDLHHDTFTQEQSKGQDTTLSFNLKREF